MSLDYGSTGVLEGEFRDEMCGHDLPRQIILTAAGLHGVVDQNADEVPLYQRLAANFNAGHEDAKAKNG